MDSEIQEFLDVMSGLKKETSVLLHPKPSPGVEQLRQLVESHIYGLLSAKQLEAGQVQLLNTLTNLYSNFDLYYNVEE